MAGTVTIPEVLGVWVAVYTDWACHNPQAMVSQDSFPGGPAHEKEEDSLYTFTSLFVGLT